jgi:CRP-like cAMP-binding protein
MVNSLYFFNIVRVIRYSFQDASLAEQYVVCIYWVIQVLISGGFGDIAPYTIPERFFYIVVVVIGVAFYSFTLGTLTSILTTVDKRKQGLIDKLMSLNEFSTKHRLPEHLQIKIKRIIEKNHESLSLDEQEILEDLPVPLKAEVLTFVHNRIFQSIHFFQNKDPAFIISLISLIKHLYPENNELIYRTDEQAEEIFFILDGKVKLVSDEGYIIRVYGEGTYFGDIELVKYHATRECNAITHHKGKCELIQINKEDLLKILEDFPEYKAEFEELAIERAERNKSSEILAKQANYRLSPEERASAFNKAQCFSQNLIKKASLKSSQTLTELKPRPIQEKPKNYYSMETPEDEKSEMRSPLKKKHKKLNLIKKVKSPKRFSERAEEESNRELYSVTEKEESLKSSKSKSKFNKQRKRKKRHKIISKLEVDLQGLKSESSIEAEKSMFSSMDDISKDSKSENDTENEEEKCSDENDSIKWLSKSSLCLELSSDNSIQGDMNHSDTNSPTQKENSQSHHIPQTSYFQFKK